MMPTPTRPKVREFVCPECWAESGKLCHDPRGARITTNHRARTEKAIAALNRPQRVAA